MNVMVNGKLVDWIKFASRMDDYVATRVYVEITPCSEQDAADAYCRAHESHFGKTFNMDEDPPHGNPVGQPQEVPAQGNS